MGQQGFEDVDAQGTRAFHEKSRILERFRFADITQDFKECPLRNRDKNALMPDGQGLHAEIRR